MSSDQHGLGMQKGEIFRHIFCLYNLQAAIFFSIWNFVYLFYSNYLKLCMHAELRHSKVHKQALVNFTIHAIFLGRKLKSPSRQFLEEMNFSLDFFCQLLR